MKRSLRVTLLLAAALLLVPFLPLYVERTMVRSWRVDHLGDVIEWGWKLCTLKDYWSNYNYYRPEQRRALWLCVNLSLALIYALIIAFGINRVMGRLKPRVVV